MQLSRAPVCADVFVVVGFNYNRAQRPCRRSYVMSLVPWEEPGSCRGPSGRSDVTLSTRQSAQRERVHGPFGVESLIVSLTDQGEPMWEERSMC